MFFSVFFFTLCVLKRIAVLAASLTASKLLRFGLIAVPPNMKCFVLPVVLLWLNTVNSKKENSTKMDLRGL